MVNDGKSGDVGEAVRCRRCRNSVRIIAYIQSLGADEKIYNAKFMKILVLTNTSFKVTCH